MVEWTFERPQAPAAVLFHTIWNGFCEKSSSSRCDVFRIWKINFCIDNNNRNAAAQFKTWKKKKKIDDILMSRFVTIYVFESIYVNRYFLWTFLKFFQNTFLKFINRLFRDIIGFLETFLKTILRGFLGHSYFYFINFDVHICR